MRSSILSVMMLCALLLGNAVAEDRRSVPHADGQGYDYFDAAWSLVGTSRLNHLSSFDFFDRTGRKVGWADASKPNRIDFYLANGLLFRTVVSDAAGGKLNLDAEGNIRTIGTANIRGGVDYFSPSDLTITNSSTTLEYVEFGERLGEE